MRIIKFRCWDKEEKLMHDVIVLQRDEFVAVPEIGPDGWELKKRKLANVELMQFTGIRIYDDNVYESDIIQDDEGDIYVIVWDNQRASFRCDLVGVKGYGMYDDFSLDDMCGHSSLIGNIYENSSLLSSN